MLLTEKLTGKPFVTRDDGRPEERAIVDGRRRAMKESVMRSVAGDAPATGSAGAAG